LVAHKSEWWFFNGEAIKTKASMVQVQENGSEFGGAASRVKKNYYASFLALLQM
jgi:ribosomal protein S24E